VQGRVSLLRSLHCFLIIAAIKILLLRSLNAFCCGSAALWNLRVSAVKILRKNQSLRHRDRTENHRAYFPRDSLTKMRGSQTTPTDNNLNLTSP